MEAFASVAELAGVGEKECPEETKSRVLVPVPVLLAGSLMFQPTIPMAPTVDELTVSVLVVTVQLEPPFVYAHVPL